MSFDCCLCSARDCSVYYPWHGCNHQFPGHFQRLKEPTCSSSTLAANGSASDALTTIVERTMLFVLLVEVSERKGDTSRSAKHVLASRRLREFPTFLAATMGSQIFDVNKQVNLLFNIHITTHSSKCSLPSMAHTTPIRPIFSSMYYVCPSCSGLSLCLWFT
jgi:hypothetical protein